MQPGPRQTVRFGPFEGSLQDRELRKQGIPVTLQAQPFAVLECLLARPGELVTRDELRQLLWPNGTFVDFDKSLNTAVMKLREALGDSAQAPLFVETVGRHGYRFIAHVETQPPITPALPSCPRRASPARVPRRTVVVGLALLASLLVAAVGLAGLALPSAVRRPHPLPGRAPLRQPVFRCGAGVPGRRHHRRADHGAGGDPLAARPLAAIRDPVQGQRQVHARDRPGAGGRWDRGRRGPPEREPRAGQRPGRPRSSR